MQIHEALDKLDLIHDHITRTEVYRGFRVQAVAAVGVLGLGAAAIQPFLTTIPFVWFWIIVAAICGTLGSAATLHAHFCSEDDFGRRHTRRVISQFAPCILAGGASTLGIAHASDLLGLLPGLWALIFGLGVVAARPYLPRGIGVVGLAYILAGTALILFVRPGSEPSSWAVGGVFGIGHLATALVLWLDISRNNRWSTDE